MFINKFEYRPLLFIAMLALAGNAFAQVYKSTDEEGNVIYSDTPTQDSDEVEVPRTNVVDPGEVPEFVPEPAPKKQEANPLRRQPGEELVGEIWVRDKDDNRKRLRELRIEGPANPDR